MMASSLSEPTGKRCPRWLVIVSSERASEHDEVKRHFAEVPCDVILDRRVAQRVSITVQHSVSAGAAIGALAVSKHLALPCYSSTSW